MYGTQNFYGTFGPLRVYVDVGSYIAIFRNTKKTTGVAHADIRPSENSFNNIYSDNCLISKDL